MKHSTIDSYDFILYYVASESTGIEKKCSAEVVESDHKVRLSQEENIRESPYCGMFVPFLLKFLGDIVHWRGCQLVGYKTKRAISRFC